MSHLRKRWPALLSLLAVAAVPLIIAACGSSSSSASSSPAMSAAASPAMSPSASAMAQKDIVDTAVAAGQFKTLATALQAAGLVNALKAPGPFTVFAPTDAAFAKLPKGTIAKLLKDPKGELTKILEYHVIAGKVMAADITNGMTAKTLEGSTVKFTVKNGKVYVNGALVTTADVAASNGVIHVISGVLIPKK
jgi:transforming growth factor-beta-induced protein